MASSHDFTRTRPRDSLSGILDVERGRVVGGREAERRVAVGAEDRRRVELDAPVPAQHADVEVEDGARVPTGEEDREETRRR